MRTSGIWIAAALLAFAAPLGQAGVLPLFSSIEPASGKAGDVITARGADLGSDVVAAVYLTDGTNDTKLIIVEQTATVIKFKIPAGMKPGRLALMVLTAGKDARLIEEPVKITIEPETTG